MGMRPQRMADQSVRVRLQKTGDEQPIDPVFGHKALPVEDQYDAAIVLRGQPRFNVDQRLEPRMSGDGAMTMGYICFSTQRLALAGIEDPRVLKNARVVGFFRNGAWQDEDYVITEVRHRGHLPDLGPLLVKCFFEKHKDLRGSN